MKVLGIIAEYNPFHLGHLYHLKQSLERLQPDYTVAVMSGNFTQRGEAALTDKWHRAQTAVRNGIDLVLELPVVYAVQTAELFAYGGIQTLNHTGVTTHVSFGSEIGDLKPLHTIADALVKEAPVYQRLLKEQLQRGLSFPAARYQALQHYLIDTGAIDPKDPQWKPMLAGSNSILAIEYLKALKRTNSTIEPFTVTRIHSAYNSPKLKKGISSATSIRREIFLKGLSEGVRESVPAATFDLLQYAFAHGMGPVDNRSLEGLLLGLVRRSSLDEIAGWLDVGEGLENRIRECGLKASSLTELLDMLKTKRYVYTRLQRILIHGLLRLTTQGFGALHDETGPKYLRILAFSSKAAPLMKALRVEARVPVITKAAHVARYSRDVQEMFAYDSLATDLYGLGLQSPGLRKGGRDFTEGVFRL